MLLACQGANSAAHVQAGEHSTDCCITQLTGFSNENVSMGHQVLLHMAVLAAGSCIARNGAQIALSVNSLKWGLTLSIVCSCLN